MRSLHSRRSGQSRHTRACSGRQGGLAIEFFILLIPFINEYWYITTPEVLYLMFVTGRVIGWYAFILFFIYSLLIFSYPIPTMAIVGIVMAVHIGYLLLRNVLGDKLAKEKTDTVDQGQVGVPEMAPIQRTEGTTGYGGSEYGSNKIDDPYTCPYCGSSNTDGNHCYDCGEDF